MANTIPRIVVPMDTARQIQEALDERRFDLMDCLRNHMGMVPCEVAAAASALCQAAQFTTHTPAFHPLHRAWWRRKFGGEESAEAEAETEAAA